MSKYLVIDFNRYETHQSLHKIVECESITEAFLHDVDCDNQEREWIVNNIVHVSDTFSCIPGDEFDTLVYKID